MKTRILNALHYGYNAFLIVGVCFFLLCVVGVIVCGLKETKHKQESQHASHPIHR